MPQPVRCMSVHTCLDRSLHLWSGWSSQFSLMPDSRKLGSQADICMIRFRRTGGRWAGGILIPQIASGLDVCKRTVKES